MALELSYTDQFGATHSAAYLRVIELISHYDLGQATIRAAIYVDANARLNKAEPLTRDILISLSENTVPTFLDTLGDDSSEKGIFPRAIAYSVLKTLPEFSSAKDV
jgi:hypothetical protein